MVGVVAVVVEVVVIIVIALVLIEVVAMEAVKVLLLKSCYGSGRGITAVVSRRHTASQCERCAIYT